MRIFFDINVILDVLCKRQPWSGQSAELLSLVDQGDIEGMLCASSLVTLDYLLAKEFGTKATREQLKKFVKTFTIASVDQRVLLAAFENGLSDYEDAVLYETACRSGADAIVTGDRDGFKKSKLPIYHPNELHVIALSE